MLLVYCSYLGLGCSQIFLLLLACWPFPSLFTLCIGEINVCILSSLSLSAELKVLSTVFVYYLLNVRFAWETGCGCRLCGVLY